MSPIAERSHDFATEEWWRLYDISTKYEPQMRLAYTRAMVNGTHINTLELRKVVIDVLAETCLSTAEAYNLVFNPNSPVYIETVDSLTAKYAGLLESPDARAAVVSILPKNLSPEDRLRRSNTFGLDKKSALDVEIHRQKLGDEQKDIADTKAFRANVINVRGNRIATTETNRVVNAALEALWLDNQNISKALTDITFYDSTIKNIGAIPRSARKIIVTRRDDRVCSYCDPLDGEKAKLGEMFDTDYGTFTAPPFHPNCRCFLIVSTK